MALPRSPRIDWWGFRKSTAFQDRVELAPLTLTPQAQKSAASSVKQAGAEASWPLVNANA